MNTYDVQITEILKVTISVDAEDVGKAEELARKKYDKEDVILGAENLVDVEFLVTDSSQKRPKKMKKH